MEAEGVLQTVVRHQERLSLANKNNTRRNQEKHTGSTTFYSSMQFIPAAILSLFSIYSLRVHLIL